MSKNMRVKIKQRDLQYLLFFLTGVELGPSHEGKTWDEGVRK